MANLLPNFPVLKTPPMMILRLPDSQYVNAHMVLESNLAVPHHTFCNAPAYDISPGR